MNRRDFLRTGTAATAGASVFAAPAEKPDIIFFMLDQISASWLWGPASRSIPMPNFDRLKARGVAFGNAFVSNPICCASRATLATGLGPRGHGVLQNGYELDSAIPTFMHLLQKAGWRTVAAGKVHFLSQFHGVHHDYRPYGFDVVHYTEDARAGNWLDWIEREHPKHFRAALATIWGTEIPELKAYGPGRIDLSSQIREIRSGFKWATSEFPHSTPGRYTLPFPAEVSQTEWITRHAVDLIRNSPRRQPLCAHVSYVQPHSPSCPPGEYMKLVDESRLPGPAGIEWLNDPLRPTCFPKTEGARTRMPEDWRVLRHYYFADLAHLDRQLGEVLRALEETGRLGNAYIVLLTDHGELLLDHGFSGKGERHYDSCVHIPLIVSGPGLRQGLEREEFVQLEDIFPTVLEMAGLQAPRPVVVGPYLKMPAGAESYPGRSLLGLCRGEQAASWRDEVYIESYNNISSTTPEWWARTVRTKDWRYTLYPGGHGEQLFSMRDDPGEQRNLAGDGGAAVVRREMRDRLLEQVIMQDYPHTSQSRYSLGVY